MGTTVGRAYCENDTAYVAHVGDSRVYVCATGIFSRLTEDHSQVMELVKYGNHSREELQNHDDKTYFAGDGNAIRG